MMIVRHMYLRMNFQRFLFSYYGMDISVYYNDVYGEE
jgi:hypothetical protein